jgi:drug/metabolite transporter (DMT)-like permease
MNDTHQPSLNAPPEADTTQAWALAGLIAGGCCLGLSPVLVKSIALPYEVSAFFRVALSAPLFIAWAFVSGMAGRDGLPQRPTTPKAQRGDKTLYALYALAAVFFAADLVVMHKAITMTSVATATLFTNCAPLFVAIYGFMGLVERSTAAFWRALPFSLVGILLIVGTSGSSYVGTPQGDAVALLAGALYAAYLATVKALRARGASSTHVMAVVGVGTAILILPLAVAQGPFSAITPGQWAMLLALALVGQAAGQGLVAVTLRRLPVASSSVILMIQPVIAAVLSWLFLQEYLSVSQMVGIALVLVGLYLATGRVSGVSIGRRRT